MSILERNSSNMAAQHPYSIPIRRIASSRRSCAFCLLSHCDPPWIGSSVICCAGYLRAEVDSDAKRCSVVLHRSAAVIPIDSFQLPTCCFPWKLSELKLFHGESSAAESRCGDSGCSCTSSGTLRLHSLRFSSELASFNMSTALAN